MKKRIAFTSVFGWFLLSLARGLAFFLGVYAALSLVGVLFGSGYNTNSWWIDLNNLPRFLSLLAQAGVAAALVALSFKVPKKLLWRIVGAAICVLFAWVALQNALAVYRIAELGLIRLGFPTPFSLFIMIAFVLLALTMFFGHRAVTWRVKWRGEAGTVRDEAAERADETAGDGIGTMWDETTVPDLDVGKAEEGARQSGLDAGKVEAKQSDKSNRTRRRNPTQRRRPARPATVLVAIIAVLACGVAFPWGQVYCFGMTDYRNPAEPVDAVVIFGAQVHPDGRLSVTLRNRVDAGIELYEQGCTKMLIMSGGTGWEGVNEAEAMRLYAIERGVPASAILVDVQGNSTELSVANTRALAQKYGYERLGAVSSFYHMARIKMLYLYEGLDVVTVPASSAGEGLATQRAAIREIPGWWFYWFKNLLR